MQVQLLSVHARLPERATDGSAGYDLFAADLVTIGRDTRELVPLDLAIAIPDGYVGMLKSRSSLAVKGLDVVAGVIDSDYRGPVKVVLHNSSTRNLTVHKGDKVAQMLLLPVAAMEVVKVEKLNETQRGTGGFGSTDP